MARENHTIAAERPRNRPKTIAFCCCLVLAVFFAGPLRADYAITGFDGKVTTVKSYWIEGQKLFFPDGEGSSLDVYTVKSVTGVNQTVEQAKQHDEAMQAFRNQVSEFLKKEKAIADAQTAHLDKIIRLAAEKKIESLGRKEKKAFRNDLKTLEQSIEELMNEWKQAKLPDFSLLLLRDTKVLQLVSLDASIEKSIKYIESADPTNREYAKAHMFQYGSFAESVKAAEPWK